MSKEEALKYLEVWGFKKEEALELYEFTGGHMVHLNFAADLIKNKNKKAQGMYWRKRRNSVGFLTTL